MPAEQYAQSFGQVYEQGRLGASEQRAMRYAEGMNQDVAAAAYRAGLAAGQKGVNNGSIEVTDEGQVGQAGQRAEEMCIRDRFSPSLVCLVCLGVRAAAFHANHTVFIDDLRRHLGLVADGRELIQREMCIRDSSRAAWSSFCALS